MRDVTRELKEVNNYQMRLLRQSWQLIYLLKTIALMWEAKKNARSGETPLAGRLG
jgi:hypothetical protein